MPRTKAKLADREVPSVTGAVLDFMLEHSRSVVSAKAVADSLGLDRKVTATILSRLAHEGRLVKLDRGRYSSQRGARDSARGQRTRPQHVVLTGGQDLWNKAYDGIMAEVMRVVGPASGKRLDVSALYPEVRERTERLIAAIVRDLGGRLALDLVQPVLGEVFGENGKAAAVRLCFPRGGV